MSNDGNPTIQLDQARRRFGLPVDLNIKRFKRYLTDNYPNITKQQRNYAIRKYKEEAWSDYDEMVTFKLAEPSRNIVKKKENDGKQSEQASDLPVAGE